MNKFISLSAFFNFVIFSFLQGEQNNKIYYLDDYVVSSSRFEQKLSELSPSILLYNTDDIKSGQYKNLSEIINNSSGLFAVPNGGVGAATSLFTRGSESGHTAIIMNGRKLPSGFSNQYELGQLSLANLQSVEIIKGDSTILYGGALSGLVNLRSNNKVENGERLVLETGSNRFRYFDYNTINNLKDSFVSFGINWTNDKGYMKNPYERYSTNIYYSNDISNKILFDFQYYGLDSSIGVPGPFAKGADYNNWDPSKEINDTRTQMLSPGLVVKLSEVSELDLKLNFSENQLYAKETSKAWLQDLNYNWYLSDKNSDATYIENINYLEALLKYDRYRNSKLLFGYVLENRDYSRKPLGMFSKHKNLFLKYNTNAIFAQALLGLGKDTVIKMASKYADYSNYFDHTFNRSLELSHKFGIDRESLIFAKFSFGATSPEINAIINISEDINYLNNNKFDNESMRSLELGIKSKIISGKNLSLVYFDNSINNIADKYLNNYAFVDTEQRGYEFSFEGPISDSIIFDVSYSYLDSVITDGKYFGGYSGEKGHQLIRRPKHKLVANLLWQYNQSINFGLNLMQARGREDFTGFSVGKFEDITLIKLLSTVEVTKNSTISLRVENLLNEEYEWTGGYPGAQRSFYAGMDIKF